MLIKEDLQDIISSRHIIIHTPIHNSLTALTGNDTSPKREKKESFYAGLICVVFGAMLSFH